ncbi:something about silencing protein 10 [Caerostris extrusa]|uniref:Something about silencing protein 10 n=1 Tax=Caerostris extrusa TaxID=172846 RepID=A0AAV4TR43_CAEEX|nr:something about silencing protein 10 [Caerostris extrusa]
MSKRKLKGNIPLDNFSDSDADVNDNDLLFDEREAKDDELSTDDELIQHREESSEEEEVLPITDDESDDDDDMDEEKDGPNQDAWGKKKSTYYNADFEDEDRGRTYREEDLEKAQAESEEALAIQKSVSKYAADDIAELSIMPETELPKKESEGEAEFDSLDSEQKLRLFMKKKCPELLSYATEFKIIMAEIKNKYVPLIDRVKQNKISNKNLATFIKSKYQALMLYCVNISFYMALRNKGPIHPLHPIFQRIKSFKEILDGLDKKFKESLSPKILEEIAAKNITRKIRFADSVAPGDEVEDMELENDDDEEAANDEKRTVTYQIAKNKGLTPKRKKEYRNPRVRNRMKFRKAKIRRKGQVREVVREIKRYDGEASGISANVVRSIKLK